MMKSGISRLASGVLGIVVATAAAAQPPSQSSLPQTFEKRLGRLFTTPDERAKLDKTRGVVQQQAPKTAQTVIVNGVILRPGKTPILFLDGKEATGGRVEIGTRAQIQARTDDGQSVNVKPGQYVDLGSGRTTEGYQLIPSVTLPPTSLDERAKGSNAPAEKPPASATGVPTPR